MDILSQALAPYIAVFVAGIFVGLRRPGRFVSEIENKRPLSELECLALLEAFFVPLTEEEREERRRVLIEAGTIDCDAIIARLSGEAA